MRLLIHAGLHKTASTFFQHVLIKNRRALLDRGVYVRPDNGFEANHATAWAAIGRDYRGVEAHVRQAIADGCQVALLSSEDFETLIFSQHTAGRLEEAAHTAGATSVEWHVVLRDPGEYFTSMYAELGKHDYVEFSSMFVAAFTEGRVHVERDPASQPRHFDYCFDAGRYLPAFARRVSGDLAVHDFSDKLPFPGHGIIASLGVSDAITELPDQSVRNSRMPIQSVTRQMGLRLAAVTEAAGLPDDVAGLLRDHLFVTSRMEETCAAAISTRFAPGMEQVLAQKRIGGSKAKGVRTGHAA